jgi:hypothetical protein
VFNPEHGPRTDFCTIRLPIEGGRLPTRLVDTDGLDTPLQVLERGLHAPQDIRERVVAGFVAPEVPGFGYRSFRIEYADTAVVGARHASPAGAPFIENDLFRVEASAEDGTLTLIDKRTGVTYRGLNHFVDGGERGDEYTYCPPRNDDMIDGPVSPAAIRVIESGPARHALEIRMTHSLPAGLSADRTARSDDQVDCEIISRVSLYPGVARIDIETEIDNRAEDHRLRVHFPTGIRTDHTNAEQHFGVVQRPAAVPEDDGTWFETPVGTYPQKTFVDVSDGERPDGRPSGRGLMISNRGLPEYEALEEADGTVTIALTLLRCVGWLSRHDLSTRKTGHAGPGMETPGAQMPGRWTFNYSIIPHEGGWENAYAEAHRFVRPLRAIRTRGGDSTLPASDSLVDVKPADLILSALKQAEDGGAVLRLYNIGSEPVRGHVRLNAACGKIERVNLNEEEPQPLDVHDGHVELSLRPNEITTLKFS